MKQKMKYNVLVPVYKKAGKTIVKGKETDLFSVSWKKVGEANDLESARKFVKYPILEEK